VKIGIIFETKEAEKVWNAFRFANACIGRGHELRVFLMGEAVECEQIEHEKYNVSKEMSKFLDREGILLACGTCILSRKLEDQTVCPISTMNDCVDLVEWADKVVTF
jgi:sulfur relay (sulfurtransferase) complex TusBCD TusD component (DsrE family)